MTDLQRIYVFLRAARRRAHVEVALRLGGITGAACVGAVGILALSAARIGPASFWPKLTATVLITLSIVGALVAVLGPSGRLRSERRIALMVGRRVPRLASDLLSAVELGASAAASTDGAPEAPSASITDAFFATVATSASALDVRRIIPLAAAARAGAAFALILALLLAGAGWAPSTIGLGLGLLTRYPTRFEGAAPSTTPLIGDVALVYVYPAYTGLPKRTVLGSTGDIVAIKGTQVTLQTHILHRARQALLLLGDAGEAGELQASLSGDRLTASMTLSQSGSYRVWLSPLLGRPVRETRPHRIIAETDAAPRADILGPADRLVLPGPRPIEVGFSASDDYGLGTVDLVYQVSNGPEQRLRLRDAAGARTTRGSTVFEPALASLGPGETIAYHIEAKDRDDVSGAKVGSSRTLYIVIENPRETLDQQLAREHDILDRLVTNMADRLELPGPSGDTKASAVSAVLPEPGARLSAWQSVHEAQESHLALLGRVVDDERRTGSAAKTLINALAAVADRLGKTLREETAVLTVLRGKADLGQLVTGAFSKLFPVTARNMEELERSVLLLDDLISRQRLEDLAGAAKELSDAFRQLQDLMNRYASTHDQALRREIERKLRDLRARINELAEKIAAIKARNEVSTEWQNMPDTKQLNEQAQKLDSLLDKGDDKSLAKAMSELGTSLSSLKDMLEKNSSDFENQRFPQENKALSEFMKQVEDLEGDERAVAGDSQSLAGEMDEEMKRRMKGQLDKLASETAAEIERLREKLAAGIPRDVDEDSHDEVKRARESAKQLKRLVADKEWGEAKREAERATSSLRKVRKALDDRARKSSAPQSEAFNKEMGDASTLAQEIASNLDKLLPGGLDHMSPEQKERSKGLSQRQSSLQQRSDELSKEAGKKAGQIPGIEQAEGELKGAAGQIQESGGDFQRGSAKEGSAKARDAAERLAQLRNSMKNEQSMGRGQNNKEPVRIPGADDSKAPREWRQELMEAMREKAPERFREEIRKYYEELIK